MTNSGMDVTSFSTCRAPEAATCPMWPNGAWCGPAARQARPVLCDVDGQALYAVLSLLYTPAELCAASGYLSWLRAWLRALVEPTGWGVQCTLRPVTSSAREASSDAYCSRSVRPCRGSGSGRPVTPTAREASCATSASGVWHQTRCGQMTLGSALCLTPAGLQLHPAMPNLRPSPRRYEVLCWL